MVLVKAVPAPTPRSEAVKWGAWVYAGILVSMVLLQLFAFEKFLPLIEAYGIPGGDGVAALIVVLEVFSLPFLLRMPLSPLARICSMAGSMIVPLAWFALGALAFALGLANAGILGPKVNTPAAMQIILAVLLGGLAMWTARGLFFVGRHQPPK
jgi:hypothetical protein